MMKSEQQKAFDEYLSVFVDGVLFNKDSNNVLFPVGEVPEKHLFNTKTKHPPVLVMHEKDYSQEELDAMPNPFKFNLFKHVCCYTLYGEKVKVSITDQSGSN